MTPARGIDDVAAFLSTSALVQGLEPAQVRELAAVCVEQRYAAGTQLLKQGAQNAVLYFLRSGSLAVRVTRGRDRITVARLEPPAVVGEISFATGRTCSADIEVVIDAALVALPLAALDRLPVQRSHILRELMIVIAERLHTTMTRGVAALRPVVLLRQSPAWAAPRAFGVSLAAALAREMGVKSLVAHLGQSVAADDPAPVGQGAWQTGALTGRGAPDRSTLAESLTAWGSRHEAIVLNSVPSVGNAEDLGAFATHQIWLLGPGDSVPADADSDHIIVQDAIRPTLPWLSARRRLVHLADAEQALKDGRDTPSSLRSATEAIARGIVGRHIGLALGGGGAWGWAHVGVLEVLERAGIPVDAIAGCSMGCVVGGLRASGASLTDLHGIADYWKRRHRRWSEFRVWRLHVANERRLTKAFREMFGDRRLEAFATPFWTNAIDIENAEEVVLKDGTLVDAVRASMAFPGWTPPVRRGDRWLVDAAMIDPVPAALVKRMHCDRVIAVNTLGPMTPQKLESRLPKQAYDVMGRYLRIAAHEVGRIHGDIAANVTITPLVGETTMLSFNKSDELIDAGRRAAEERLPLIREACQPVRSAGL